MINALLLLMEHFCPDLIFEMPGPGLLIVGVRVEAVSDLAGLSLLAVEVEEVQGDDRLDNIPFIARGEMGFWLLERHTLGAVQRLIEHTIE